MIHQRSCLLRCWFAALFNWSLFRPLITWYSFQRRVGEKMPKISLLRRYGQASWQKRSIVLKPHLNGTISQKFAIRDADLIEPVKLQCLAYWPAHLVVWIRHLWLAKEVITFTDDSLARIRYPRDIETAWRLAAMSQLDVTKGFHGKSRLSKMLNLRNNFLPFFTSLLSCLEITREVET